MTESAEQGKYEQVKTSDLIPYVNNAKTHPDEQVAKIASSIKEFGPASPILIDKDNGIIAGHGRLLAAQKLGLKTFPCVRLSHLTETQKKALILADNRLGEVGGTDWDLDMVSLELEGLQDDSFNLDLTGFDEEARADIFCVIEDIEDVDHFNETFSVAIGCNDLAELALVQQALGVSGKKITAQKILEMVGQ